MRRQSLIYYMERDKSNKPNLNLRFWKTAHIDYHVTSLSGNEKSCHKKTRTSLKPVILFTPFFTGGQLFWGLGSLFLFFVRSFSWIGQSHLTFKRCMAPPTIYDSETRNVKDHSSLLLRKNEMKNRQSAQDTSNTFFIQLSRV